MPLNEVASYFQTDGTVEWIQVDGAEVEFERREAGKFYYVSTLDRDYKLGETFVRNVRTKMLDCIDPLGDFFFVDHTLPCEEFTMKVEISGRTFDKVEINTLENNRPVNKNGHSEISSQRISWFIERPKLFSVTIIRWTTKKIDAQQ